MPHEDFCASRGKLGCLMGFDEEKQEWHWKANRIQGAQVHHPEYGLLLKEEELVNHSKRMKMCSEFNHALNCEELRKLKLNMRI